MNTIELIKDAAFFGGHIPNERLKECRDFFDNVIEKQLTIPVVVKSFYCNNEVIGLKTQCKEQCKECGKWINTAFKQ